MSDIRFFSRLPVKLPHYLATGLAGRRKQSGTPEAQLPDRHQRPREWARADPSGQAPQGAAPQGLSVPDHPETAPAQDMRDEPGAQGTRPHEPLQRRDGTAGHRRQQTPVLLPPCPEGQPHGQFRINSKVLI